jgi:hypothetical protein
MSRPCTIDTNKIYTREACKLECGISREQLRQGRAAGVLKPSSKGRYRYYKGSELAAWVFNGK